MTFTIEDKKLLNSGNRLFVLTYDELLDLINAANKATALMQGGVDNWESYGWAMSNFLTDAICEYQLDEDTTFKQLAKYEIEKFYENVEVILNG